MFFLEYSILIVICIVGYLLYNRKKEEIEDIKRKLSHQELLRQQERNGRIKAEKNMAEIQRRLQSQPIQTNATTTTTTTTSSTTSNKTNQEKDDDGGANSLRFRVIGRLESVFKERNGTPRQGNLVPDGRAKLKLASWVNGVDSLDGLNGFSHVWIVFVFHENTNDHKLESVDKLGVHSKIRPPRLDGAKVGLFATRTPHRANSIGLSLVKLDRIEKDSLFLSGIDILDGTPILDVKPYVPYADGVNNVGSSGGGSTARVPSWVENSPGLKPFKLVQWEESIVSQLEFFLDNELLQLYRGSRDLEPLKRALEQIVGLDVRSTNQRHKNAEESESKHSFKFDRLLVVFVINSIEHTASIHSITLVDDQKKSSKKENEKMEIEKMETQESKKDV